MQQLLSLPLNEAVARDPSFFVNHATNYFAIQRNLPASQPPPDEQISKKVFWYYRKIGTGKSFTARSQMRRLYEEMHCDYNTLPMQPSGNFWFYSYHQQKLFLAEEIRGSTTSLQNLLMLTDKYPCVVQTKGGHEFFTSEFIWFTCPCSPEECFPSAFNDRVDQLLRRITLIVEFRVNYNPEGEPIYERIFHKGDQTSFIEPWNE